MISMPSKEKIYQKTNGLCFYCGTPIYPVYIPSAGRELWAGFQRDHIIPRSQGGTNDIENIVPACTRCNGLKCDLSIEGFRELAKNNSIVALRSCYWQSPIINDEGLFYFEIQGMKP